MSGYYHGNPNYNTISSSNTQGEGGGNVFRIVMPHGQMVREESVQSPQIINIGPSGIRTVSGVGQRPHVRVMERQPSGGFRIIGGTGGGIQMVENPYSTMGRAQRSGSGGAQQMRIMPSGGQGGPFRIHVMQGGDTSSAPSTPPAYTSTVSYSTHTAQPHVYVHSESHAPTTYHTLTRSTSHGDSQDGAYDIPVRYQPRPPLANTGRSNSVDCGGVNINSGDGSTVYHTGPGRMSFSISGSGVQPVTPQTSTAATRGPVFYVRTNSGSREGTRESSPKIQVTRIKEALDGRRQQHNPNFDELIRSKLQNFVQGDHPQYLFRHQPQAAPTRATSTPPKHEEYIFVARPQFQTSTPSSATGTPTGTPTGTIRLRSGTPVYPGTPDGTMRSGQGTPDSTMRRGSTGSISSVGPGKKIVRTTREEIRDVGGGQTQTIREIHEELVDDEDEKGSKENVAPAIVTDNVDTWKSTTSNDSGNGSGDRNLFKKFRFKFDSIGNFGRSDSRESTGNKEMFHFQDFDDMVGGMSNLRLPARHQLVIPQATGTTCPYCNNNNPGAAKSSAGSTESTTTDNKPSTATCKSAESTLQIPGSPRNQHGRDVRPKSFLREEMDEFDRIFSELLLFSPGKKFSDYINVEEEGEESSEQCLEAETIFSYDTDKMEKMNKSGAKSHEHTSCDKCKGAYNVDGCNSSDCTELCKLSPRSQSCPCGHSISDSSSPAKGDSPDTGQGDPVVSPGKVLWDDNDKLFTQLLDDLDNITGDTPSVRRRKKARDLFSNWLFSEDSKSPEHPVKRCKEVFRDLAKRRSVDLDTRKQQQDLYTRWRPRSFEYLSEVSFSRLLDLFSSEPPCFSLSPTDCEYTCHNKCRQGVSLDCATSGQPESKPAVERQSRKQETVLAADQSSAQAVRSLDSNGRLSQDDADSGYHTGSSTLTSRGPRGAKRPPGEWTLTREDLRRNIETFNNNNHGLIMSLQQDTNTFQGFIRVHMNLIRPINMSLSLRPPSIYDVIGQGEEEDEHNDGTHTTSFYLPKDTTKVIHINSDTTAQEVIKALLSKFKITDNPRKFALYERLEESSNKATMRRLEDEECPLPLCLCWTADGVEGLDCRRYVLQENDTGEIMWEAFSLPELENFLKILNREEEEYVEQVKGKYRMLKIHMQRRLVELDNKPTEETTLTDDKRRPVFV